MDLLSAAAEKLRKKKKIQTIALEHLGIFGAEGASSQKLSRHVRTSANLAQTLEGSMRPHSPELYTTEKWRHSTKGGAESTRTESSAL